MPKTKTAQHSIIHNNGERKKSGIYIPWGERCWIRVCLPTSCGAGGERGWGTFSLSFFHPSYMLHCRNCTRTRKKSLLFFFFPISNRQIYPISYSDHYLTLVRKKGKEKEKRENKLCGFSFFFFLLLSFSFCKDVYVITFLK